MDTVIQLARPSDYSPAEGARFLVNFTKARGLFGDAADAFEAMLQPSGEWTRRSAADALATQAVALAAEGLSQRDIATELGVSAAKVNRILKRARGEG